MKQRPRVIGGEFEIAPALLVPPASDHELPRRLPFASGRAALHAVARDARATLGVRRLLLPDYLCDTAIVALEDAGLDIAYYPVAEDLLPAAGLACRAAEAGAGTAVLLVEYFGLVDLSPVLAELGALERRPVTIVDRVQSPRPAMRYDADYEVTGLRKHLPVPDGADASRRGVSLPPASDAEPGFTSGKVLGNLVKAWPDLGTLPDSVYLQFTEAAEAMLDADHHYDGSMSRVSRTILSNLDREAAAAVRRANFARLEALLAEAGVAPMVPMGPDATPLYFPVLLERRDDARGALAARRIFCPVHWPHPTRAHYAPDTGGSRLWSRELSLVIDQRYGPDEMDELAEVLARLL